MTINSNFNTFDSIKNDSQSSGLQSNDDRLTSVGGQKTCSMRPQKGFYKASSSRVS